MEGCLQFSVTQELRLAGGEGASHVEIWGSRLSGSGKSECNGPGAGACQAGQLRHNKEGQSEQGESGERVGVRGSGRGCFRDCDS